MLVFVVQCHVTDTRVMRIITVSALKKAQTGSETVKPAIVIKPVHVVIMNF